MPPRLPARRPALAATAFLRHPRTRGTRDGANRRWQERQVGTPQHRGGASRPTPARLTVTIPASHKSASRYRFWDTSTRGRRERGGSAHTLSRHHEAIAHELRAARPAPRPQGQTSPSGPWRPEAEAHGLPPQRRRTRSLEARAGPVAARLPCCLSGRSGTFAPATLPRPAIRSRS